MQSPSTPAHKILSDVDRLGGLQAAAAGVWSWDVRSGKVTLDSRMEALSGLAAGTFDGTPGMYINTVYSEDREMVALNIEQVLADCAPTYRARHRVQLLSGELRWLWKIGGVVVDEGGKSLRLQGIALDITHEVQLEQALAFSAETLGMYTPGEDYCILRTWPDRPEVPAEVLVGSLEKVAGLHFSASRSTPGSRWKPVGDPRDPDEDARCHEQMYRVLRDDGQIGWIRERSRSWSAQRSCSTA